MQLVRNGPDIPERLLQAHEEGRVVFFCGAGISYPAGLPGFAGLVERLYQALAPNPNAVQRAAIKSRQFDTAIGLLESDTVNGREAVRQQLATVLTATSNSRNSTATHEAMLTLSCSRDGKTRLITTNFDRLFEDAIAARSLDIDRYRAPLLPVPKNRWNGLVYLHGLLDASPNRANLDRLVVSSGDFGLAYLTERWASRFVGELFRNYTVCFVGYSINDPVLRYMTDALAADKLLGESSPEMFAFGSFSKAQEKDRANDWRAKNVTPILYREHRRHSYLHETLRAWAEVYRDGIRGKESIVASAAIGRPLASTKQDDFVGRVLWALSDLDGLPAKRFADMNPVPSLEWLDALSNNRFGQVDLARFRIARYPSNGDKLAFSLLHRPTPYTLAPWMSLVSRGGSAYGWDAVMHELARWLARHLDDPVLLIWMAKHGGRLHDHFVRIIEHELERLDALERSGATTELEQIRVNAPNAVPRSMMRTLWRLLLTGRVKANGSSFDLYRWHDRFRRDGMSASLRIELRSTLTPCITLSDPFQWPRDGSPDTEPNRIRDLVEWQLELATENVHSWLQDVLKDERWSDALEQSLDDFTTLLRDALDLRRELGDVDDRSDHSYIHRPSISSHEQNTDFHDWTVLIDLARDAWMVVAERSPKKARNAAEGWLNTPYPLFRRLAFFAAAQSDVVSARLAIDWLLSDGHWWLWSIETQREAMRLLVALAPRLEPEMLKTVEDAIVAGPPRELVGENVGAEEWTGYVAHEVWLRLAKMASTGIELHDESRQQLDRLSNQNPEWHLEINQREEFPAWSESGGWVGEGAPWHRLTKLPHSRRGVLKYLREHPDPQPGQQDDWKERCVNSFQATAYALYQLAQQNVWPAARWRDALQVWSDDKFRSRSWRYMAPVLRSAPDPLFAEIGRSISWWTRQAAEAFEGDEQPFLEIAERLLHQVDDDVGPVDDHVFQAINHPVGHVTEALLRRWYRQPLEDGQGLDIRFAPIFTALCDTRVAKFRHGRVLLAAHVITLFRVDMRWASQHLVPLFDWHRSEAEARSAWKGFLWSPRLYRPLMELLKPAFLATAHHYTQLGNHGKQYATVLTLAALDPGDTFSRNELAAAMQSLPKEGLRTSAGALVRALDGAGDQREDYWRHRVLPFWEKVWPKSKDALSAGNAEILARLCIAAGDEFPSAVRAAADWLLTVHHPDSVVRALHSKDLAGRFPEQALHFLDAILQEQPEWAPRDLRLCLERIVQAAPSLAKDHRWLRLDQYALQTTG